MSSHAIPIHLEPDNLRWLELQARLSGSGSLSDAINQLIATLRKGGKKEAMAPRSVRGTIRIDPSDPDLREADTVLCQLFESSLNRQEPTT